MGGPSRFQAFLAELKRRQVLRVATAYLAVAIATVSVASDFLPALRLPSWTVTLVAALTLLGFPIAVALAWAYDLTPQGVRRTAATEPEADGAEPPTRKPSAAGDRGLGARAAGLVGLGVVLAIVSVGAVSQLGFPGWWSRASALPSIAVLPFASMSVDLSDDYFSAGIHEDVMTQLYKLGGVTVISRTSVMQYRDASKPIRQIGEELGVQSILEASVRRIDSRVRIDARLIDVATDRTLWAESYDRELRDVLGIQAEIAEEIAGALHATLSPLSRTQLASARARAVDPQMYETYLRGLYQAGRGEHAAAIDSFRRALALDADYAPAYAAMARNYYSLAFFGELAPAEALNAMRDAATRALTLDPGLADAHAVLALFDLHYRWDWDGADRRFREALRLSPNHAQVRHDYAHYLLAVGRVGESVEESSRAATLDPGNSMLKACAGWHGFTDREYDVAVERAMGALMMMPGAFWPELILGWAYEHQGQYREAVAALRSAVAHSNGSPIAVASLAHAQAVSGERTPARQLLADLLARSRERYVSAYDLAIVYAGLGETEEVFAWLDRAHRERSVMLVNVGWDPRFDAMRGDPRFAAVQARMRLPDRPPPRKPAPTAARRASGGM